jgi:hypothetical protein
MSGADMPSLLINIDVPSIPKAVGFYTSALGLWVGRRFGDDFVELVGADVPLYLLQKGSGTSIGPAGGTSAATIAIGHQSIRISSCRIWMPRLRE